MSKITLIDIITFTSLPKDVANIVLNYNIQLRKIIYDLCDHYYKLSSKYNPNSCSLKMIDFRRLIIKICDIYDDYELKEWISEYSSDKDTYISAPINSDKECSMCSFKFHCICKEKLCNQHCIQTKALRNKPIIDQIYITEYPEIYYDLIQCQQLYHNILNHITNTEEKEYDDLCKKLNIKNCFKN